MIFPNKNAFVYTNAYLALDIPHLSEIEKSELLEKFEKERR